MNNIFIVILLTGGILFSSFQNFNNKSYSLSNCSISIDSVNDSTFVISNNSNPYFVENRILIGEPEIFQSGDTIQISGEMYSVSIVATDSNNCIAQKIINKY